MISYVKRSGARLQATLCRHKILLATLLGAATLGALSIVVVSNLIIGPNGKYILSPSSTQSTTVGIVLGAGVNNEGVPYKELQARLDMAATALETGRVGKLILSGDNRYNSYNEPAAMVAYLTNVKNIDPGKLQPDFAGRSTYESCERAAKVFGLKQTIIFSARTHLPRAIYLCRHFGIESFGVESNVEANNAGRRELVARVKAVFNATIYGENTILGDRITL